MPTSNPIEILLEHDRWGTQNIIDVCKKLPPEQFHQRFDMGPGSLHDTVTHIITALRVWEDVLSTREVLRGSKDQPGLSPNCKRSSTNRRQLLLPLPGNILSMRPSPENAMARNLSLAAPA